MKMLWKCKICGHEKMEWPCKFERPTCSRACFSVWQSRTRNGESHPCWKGGIRIYNGYRYLRKICRAEHRVIVEKAIGRSLTRDEVVHHINGVKTDNRLENLVIMKNADHSRLHRLQYLKIG